MSCSSSSSCGSSRGIASSLLAYLLVFVLGVWPPHSMHQMREMIAITVDIAGTDATPEEGLTLENIVAFESGFERTAVGPHGEVGAFQLWIFPWTTEEQIVEWKRHGAREALRRLRVQGIQGCCGCTNPVTKRCREMMEHRTFPATLYRWAFDPPRVDSVELAGQ